MFPNSTWSPRITFYNPRNDLPSVMVLILPQYCRAIREAADSYIRSPSLPDAIARNHRAWRSADGGIVDTLDTVDCRRRHWSCNLGGAAKLRHRNWRNSFGATDNLQYHLFLTLGSD